jgi:hypothetical protein
MHNYVLQVQNYKTHDSHRNYRICLEILREYKSFVIVTFAIIFINIHYQINTVI